MEIYSMCESLPCPPQFMPPFAPPLPLQAGPDVLHTITKARQLADAMKLPQPNVSDTTRARIEARGGPAQSSDAAEPSSSSGDSKSMGAAQQKVGSSRIKGQKESDQGTSVSDGMAKLSVAASAPATAGAPAGPQVGGAGDGTEGSAKGRERTCHACGSKGKMRVCSRCGEAVYCGPACQRAAWGSHKKVCKPK